MGLIRFIKRWWYNANIKTLSNRIKYLKYQVKLHKNSALSSSSVYYGTVKAVEIDERELKKAISELRRYKKLLKRV